MLHRTLIQLAIATLLTAAACADNSGPAAPTPPTQQDPAASKAGKADQWGSADDPALFSQQLEYALEALPREGEAANIPWAASYWPVYEDSINYRWAGAETDSPAAKYGKAFGVEDIERKVSENHGIDKYSSRTACTTDADCDDKMGEACAMRHGAEAGYCIPTWWGICHAWAPAAILEAEPVRAVTRGDVTFEVNDIKALMTLVYNHSRSKFVSLRCNENADADEIEYDEYQRPTGSDAECRDTNPGTYHVLLTNYLGLMGQSFVEDRTWDYQVWNQPLRGYRITMQEEITAQQANALVGVQPTSDTPSRTSEATGSVAKDEWFHAAEPVAVAAGETVLVVMTGTNDADLYVRFGEQATKDVYDCRPWKGTTEETCELTVPEAAEKLFLSVNGYHADGSEFTITTTVRPADAAVPEEYVFNNEAAKLYQVKLEVDYITEASASTDGNLADRIDSYTRTDRYEYVLEVDADGKINGGEWINGSKKAHPDFLWLPTGRNDYAIAGGTIKFSVVKQLLDESVAPETPDDGGGTTDGEPTGGPQTIREAGDLAKDGWVHFGPFESGDAAFAAAMSGTGDADLYVRVGAQPTKDEYDCRPYSNGSAETCTLNGAGAYFVSIHGYAASSYELNVTFTAPGDEPPVDPNEPPVTVEHLDVTGTVALGAMASYVVDVKAGRALVVRTEAANDVDLYVRMNLAPTTAVYDQRGYTVSGNETLTVVPNADGVLHIAVHGFKASDFTLETADN